MFFTIKPKSFLIFVLVFALSFGVAFGCYKTAKANTEPKFNYTIVLDAGHGGRDAGCIGINTGVKESDLNLAICKKLQQYLCDFGFKVIMTRETQAGLYSENVNNHKKDDLEKRDKIIENSNANMLLSIHLNSFPTMSEHGAQAFFESTNDKSVTLSNCIQKQLINNIPNARKSANKGDYYILKNKNIPCSIIECGFLTNPEEESLLITEDYQKNIAYAIMCGVIDYINTTSELSLEQ